MNIYLLTHQRELDRKTNTGVLAAEVLGDDCQVFIWRRTAPGVELLKKIKNESVAVLYPCEGSVTLADTDDDFESFIMIDATWQEAQKIYNHSPYLHDLPKVHLNPEKASIYTLRRNQKETGLCTAECVTELLKGNGNKQQAELIQERLTAFIASSS